MMPTTRYPDWAPKEIVDALVENEKDDYRHLELHDMWKRLVTDPEMEVVWRWIGTTTRNTLSHLANGGLAGSINRRVAEFVHGRKLSASDYKNEMLRINKMANALAKEIAAFRQQAKGSLDPFPSDCMLTHADTDRVASIIRPDLHSESEFDEAKRRAIRWHLDEALPTLDSQLTELAWYAKNESERQFFRLRLPRKVNDKNVFRTYFVKLVIDYFSIAFEDYSPSRIAIFCRVALEDDEIDSSMVQKHCDLDAADKNLLLSIKANSSEED